MKKAVFWIISVLSLICVIVWQIAFKSINYYIISAAFLVLSMLPFFIRYESKKENAKEISLVATLIAIAVVSRAVFYLIPQVKPIAAVVIIAAVCFGAERGYLIGAFSMFISNFLFGQGYWTPFQMAALGFVGLAAGLIFKIIKPNRYTLAIVGFVLVFAVYGVVVDISTILTAYGNKPTIEGALSIWGAGVPFNLIFGASTAVFLFLFGEPFIRKVNRITVKYNINKPA